MTTDTRLVAMESSLTVVQRARLVLQQWFTTGTVDERLWKFCPPQDHDESRKICGSVGRAHESVWRALEFLAEWLNLEDTRLGWLEAVVVMREREAILLKTAPKTARLPECPIPRRAFERDAPLLYGRIAFEEEPLPVDWDEAVRRLELEVSRVMPLRWASLIAFEEAYARASSALEMDCMHPRTRKAIDDLKRVIRGQAETMASLGWPVELPTKPEGEPLEVALEHFDWEPLMKHGSPAWDPRRSMSEQQRADFEEWERQWADEIES